MPVFGDCDQCGRVTTNLLPAPVKTDKCIKGFEHDWWCTRCINERKNSKKTKTT